MKQFLSWKFRGSSLCSKEYYVIHCLVLSLASIHFADCHPLGGVPDKIGPPSNTERVEFNVPLINTWQWPEKMASRDVSDGLPLVESQSESTTNELMLDTPATDTMTSLRSITTEMTSSTKERDPSMFAETISTNDESVLSQGTPAFGAAEFTGSTPARITTKSTSINDMQLSPSSMEGTSTGVNKLNIVRGTPTKDGLSTPTRANSLDIDRTREFNEPVDSSTTPIGERWPPHYRNSELVETTPENAIEMRFHVSDTRHHHLDSVIDDDVLTVVKQAIADSTHNPVSVGINGEEFLQLIPQKSLKVKELVDKSVFIPAPLLPLVDDNEGKRVDGNGLHEAERRLSSGVHSEYSVKMASSQTGNMRWRSKLDIAQIKADNLSLKINHASTSFDKLNSSERESSNALYSAASKTVFQSSTSVLDSHQLNPIKMKVALAEVQSSPDDSLPTSEEMQAHNKPISTDESIPISEPADEASDALNSHKYQELNSNIPSRISVSGNEISKRENISAMEKSARSSNKSHGLISTEENSRTLSPLEKQLFFPHEAGSKSRNRQITNNFAKSTLVEDNGELDPILQESIGTTQHPSQLEPVTKAIKSTSSVITDPQKPLELPWSLYRFDVLRLLGVEGSIGRNPHNLRMKEQGEGVTRSFAETRRRGVDRRFAGTHTNEDHVPVTKKNADKERSSTESVARHMHVKKESGDGRLDKIDENENHGYTVVENNVERSSNNGKEEKDVTEVSAEAHIKASDAYRTFAEKLKSEDRAYVMGKNVTKRSADDRFRGTKEGEGTTEHLEEYFQERSSGTRFTETHEFQGQVQIAIRNNNEENTEKLLKERNKEHFTEVLAETQAGKRGMDRKLAEIDNNGSDAAIEAITENSTELHIGNRGAYRNFPNTEAYAYKQVGHDGPEVRNPSRFREQGESERTVGSFMERQDREVEKDVESSFAQMTNFAIKRHPNRDHMLHEAKIKSPLGSGHNSSRMKEQGEKGVTGNKVRSFPERQKDLSLERAENEYAPEVEYASGDIWRRSVQRRVGRSYAVSNSLFTKNAQNQQSLVEGSHAENSRSQVKNRPTANDLQGHVGTTRDGNVASSRSSSIESLSTGFTGSLDHPAIPSYFVFQKTNLSEEQAAATTKNSTNVPSLSSSAVEDIRSFSNQTLAPTTSLVAAKAVNKAAISKSIPSENQSLYLSPRNISVADVPGTKGIGDFLSQTSNTQHISDILPGSRRGTGDIITEKATLRVQLSESTIQPRGGPYMRLRGDSSNPSHFESKGTDRKDMPVRNMGKQSLIEEEKEALTEAQRAAGKLLQKFGDEDIFEADGVNQKGDHKSQHSENFRMQHGNEVINVKTRFLLAVPETYPEDTVRDDEGKLEEEVTENLDDVVSTNEDLSTSVTPNPSVGRNGFDETNNAQLNPKIASSRNIFKRENNLKVSSSPATINTITASVLNLSEDILKQTGSEITYDERDAHEPTVEDISLKPIHPLVIKASQQEEKKLYSDDYPLSAVDAMMASSNSKSSLRDFLKISAPVLTSANLKSNQVQTTHAPLRNVKLETDFTTTGAQSSTPVKTEEKLSTPLSPSNTSLPRSTLALNPISSGTISQGWMESPSYNWQLAASPAFAWQDLAQPYNIGTVGSIPKSLEKDSLQLNDFVTAISSNWKVVKPGPEDVQESVSIPELNWTQKKPLSGQIFENRDKIRQTKEDHGLQDTKIVMKENPKSSLRTDSERFMKAGESSLENSLVVLSFHEKDDVSNDVVSSQRIQGNSDVSDTDKISTGYKDEKTPVDDDTYLNDSTVMTPQGGASAVLDLKPGNSQQPFVVPSTTDIPEGTEVIPAETPEIIATSKLTFKDEKLLVKVRNSLRDSSPMWSQGGTDAANSEQNEVMSNQSLFETQENPSAKDVPKLETSEIHPESAVDATPELIVLDRVVPRKERFFNVEKSSLSKDGFSTESSYFSTESAFLSDSTRSLDPLKSKSSKNQGSLIQARISMRSGELLLTERNLFELGPDGKLSLELQVNDKSWIVRVDFGSRPISRKPKLSILENAPAQPLGDSTLFEDASIPLGFSGMNPDQSNAEDFVDLQSQKPELSFLKNAPESLESSQFEDSTFPEDASIPLSYSRDGSDRSTAKDSTDFRNQNSKLSVLGNAPESLESFAQPLEYLAQDAIASHSSGVNLEGSTPNDLVNPQIRKRKNSANEYFPALKSMESSYQQIQGLYESPDSLSRRTGNRLKTSIHEEKSFHRENVPQENTKLQREHHESKNVPTYVDLHNSDTFWDQNLSALKSSQSEVLEQYVTPSLGKTQPVRENSTPRKILHQPRYIVGPNVAFPILSSSRITVRGTTLTFPPFETADTVDASQASIVPTEFPQEIVTDAESAHQYDSNNIADTSSLKGITNFYDTTVYRPSIDTTNFLSDGIGDASNTRRQSPHPSDRAGQRTGEDFREKKRQSHSRSDNPLLVDSVLDPGTVKTKLHSKRDTPNVMEIGSNGSRFSSEIAASSPSVDNVSWPWLLLLLAGNLEIATKRERDFAIYIRLNLAARIGGTFDDFVVNSVIFWPELIMNISIQPEVFNATWWTFSETKNVTLLRLNGYDFQVVGAIKEGEELTAAPLVQEKVWEPRPVLWSAIGTVAVFCVIAAILAAILHCRWTHEAAPLLISDNLRTKPPPPPPVIYSRRLADEMSNFQYFNEVFRERPAEKNKSVSQLSAKLALSESSYENSFFD